MLYISEDGSEEESETGSEVTALYRERVTNKAGAELDHPRSENLQAKYKNKIHAEKGT